MSRRPRIANPPSPIEDVFAFPKFSQTASRRCGSQVVRQRSAKPLFVGSIPTRTSNSMHEQVGVIDGDGGIRRWIHPTNGCEQWEITLVGISKKRSKYTLKYGKLAAKAILRSEILDSRSYFADGFIVKCDRRGVGMVDDGALKASGRKAVRVRIPPSARNRSWGEDA